MASHTSRIYYHRIPQSSIGSVDPKAFTEADRLVMRTRNTLVDLSDATQRALNKVQWYGKRPSLHRWREFQAAHAQVVDYLKDFAEAENSMCLTIKRLPPCQFISPVEIPDRAWSLPIAPTLPDDGRISCYVHSGHEVSKSTLTLALRLERSLHDSERYAEGQWHKERWNGYQTHKIKLLSKLWNVFAEYYQDLVPPESTPSPIDTSRGGHPTSSRHSNYPPLTSIRLSTGRETRSRGRSPEPGSGRSRFVPPSNHSRGYSSAPADLESGLYSAYQRTSRLPHRSERYEAPRRSRSVDYSLQARVLNWMSESERQWCRYR